MRFVSLAFLIALAGCGEIPSYVVQPQYLHSTASAVPAARESDGREVSLRSDSFMPTGDPPLPGGRVRVRGPGRHGTMWKTGIALTVVGWTLAITGAAIGITGFERSLGDCKLFEPCGHEKTED
jgi:hypothetical protein